VLVGASIALLLLFFAVFSSPKNRGPLPGDTARGGPSLGRKVAPGQEQNDPAKTVTPLLSADLNRGDAGSGSQVTPEEVGGTSPRYNGTPRLPSGNAAALEKPSPGRPPGCVERLRREAEVARGSQVRSSSACVLRLPDASRGYFCPGRTWDLPVPARGASVRAQGL
jgi:hypothetical protein